MYLKRISLINFKNIEEAQLDLSPRINCFTGDNGTGKTNLLDAVYYLSMCKSAFNLTDSQSTRHGTDSFMINGIYLSENQRTENILCSYKRSSHTKKVCRNGKEYDKFSNHIGLIPIVLVSPSDTMLINESGEERRRYINSFISQYDNDYLAALVKYNQLLGERNSLLKRQDVRGFDDMLDVFDMQLQPVAELIYEKRKALVNELLPIVVEYYKVLSQDKEDINLVYKSELNEVAFDEILRRNAQRDRINQYTAGGVHRDDLVMEIGGYPLRKYGSQGQQKSFLIALKLAQYDILKSRDITKPILLLDDVFDKLDLDRVSQLIAIVGEEKFGQIFITDCNKVRLNSILENSGHEYTLFDVDNGVITKV